MPDVKKILIVDDEEDFGKMVKLNLERTGKFQVMCESRGKNALSSAKAFSPDLIFLDVVMPDIDGGEVMSMLKADSQTQNYPCCFFNRHHHR